MTISTASAFLSKAVRVQLTSLVKGLTSQIQQFSGRTIFRIITWLAIIPGDSLLTSTSSGHLGQRNVRQKLYSVSGLPCFSLTDVQMELKTAGQSKVLEQLGHDKINGSQPRYLQFNL